MYPNGFNFPYSMPYPYINTIANTTTRSGLFSRLLGPFSTIRSINWSSLLNNTSKTLGVINQAIPIVKQTGPMINNMRSMLKVASAFKDVTDKPKRKNYTRINNRPKDIPTNQNTIEKLDTSNAPNFFI